MEIYRIGKPLFIAESSASNFDHLYPTIEAFCSMVISTNDHPDIRRVFDDLHMESVNIKYTVGAGAGSDAKELIIWNQNCEDRRSEKGTMSLF